MRCHGLVREKLVTSDFVIDEVLTLLKVRGNVEFAPSASEERFLSGELAEIEWVSRLDFEQAWEVFNKYRDKEWSFTDCVSFVMMRRLGIKKAFAFDEHFRQLGTVTVEP